MSKREGEHGPRHGSGQRPAADGHEHDNDDNADDENSIAPSKRPDIDTATTATASNTTNRLVFGLNSRTNRARHDEYAAVRGQQAKPASGGLSPEIMTTSTPKTTIANSAQRDTGDKKSQVSQAMPSTSKTRVATGDRQRTRSSSPKRKTSIDKQNDQQQGEPNNKTASKSDNTTGIQQADSNVVREQPAADGDPVDDDQSKTTTMPNTETTKQVKMQFNIPPPPKVKSSNQSSIVSYAKSRIYDKPKQPANSLLDLTNPSLSASTGEDGCTNLLLLSSKTHDFEHSQLLMFGLGGGSGGAQDRPKSLGSYWLQANSHQLPKSIVSGFKPPKQVDVSKAREKWEGGEPFARCKSRQRLAAAKDKRISLGWWSTTTTSVVASHQAQFQQQAMAAAKPSAATSSSEPAVKVLTRGSVLERVQQYERAPGAPANGADDEPLDEQELEILRNLSYTAPMSASKQTSDRQADAPERPPVVTRRRSSAGLRRRSSTAGLGQVPGSQMVIPRFYHPNGKPNTYEMELERRQIELCFDKFANRRAALRGPNARRHFQLIAAACNLTEYFKEPLCRYARNWLVSSAAAAAASGARSPGSPTGGTSLGMLGKRQLSVGATRRPSIGANSTTTTKATATLSTTQSHPNSTTTSTNTAGKTKAKSGSFRSASVDTPDGNPAPTTPVDDEWITCELFLACWRHLSATSFDLETKFVHLLTMSTSRDFLVPEDFIHLIQSVIDEHPGLRFLRSAPDFHMRYIQTVIARIYFDINRSWTGKISINELRRSNLLRILAKLAQEPDINQITEYFSYEHFYVIYCKFWSLDRDHDLLISAEDLAKHNDANISPLFIERIFMGIVSRHIQQTGLMSYTDFVWFLIAEEDKKHPRSIEYWFRLMDIDGDGYVSMYEMEYFYEAQAKRLPEPLPFVDTACQLLDLINPTEKNKISLADLKRNKNLATIFLDTFVNFDKYLEQESREFISSRDYVVNGKVVSDWDRYASEEYESLLLNDSETSV